MKWPWMKTGAEIAVPDAREYLDKVSALDHLSRALTYIKRLPDNERAKELLMQTYSATCDAMWPLGEYDSCAQWIEGGDGETRLHRNDESPVAESDAP